MNLRDATKLKNKIDLLLKDCESYAELHSTGTDYNVIVHDVDSNLPELPSGVKIVSVDDRGVQKDLNIHNRTPTKQTHEPTEDYIWRQRELVDIVRRVAMTKINKLADSIRIAAADRDPKIDSLLETLRNGLLNHNFSKGSKPWKLLTKIQKSYDTALMEELIDILTHRLTPVDEVYRLANRILVLIKKHPGLDMSTDKDLNKKNLATQVTVSVTAIEKALNALTKDLNRLGLVEEANQTHSMASSAHDIFLVVSKLK